MYVKTGTVFIHLFNLHNMKGYEYDGQAGMRSSGSDSCCEQGIRFISRIKTKSKLKINRVKSYLKYSNVQIQKRRLRKNNQ
jgi:hypothetical protein